MHKNPVYAKVNGVDLERNSIVNKGILAEGGSNMMIDGVLEFHPRTEDGVSITAYRQLSDQGQYFEGHFPGNPVMPRHYMLLMAYQTVCLFYFCLYGRAIGIPDSLSVDKITNRNPAKPGDTLYLTCIDPEIIGHSFSCTVLVKNQRGKTVATFDGLAISLSSYENCAEKNGDPTSYPEFKYHDYAGTLLDRQNIWEKKILPHGGASMLIDGIISYVNRGGTPTSITAVRNLSDSGVYFNGSKVCLPNFILEMCYLTAAVFRHCLGGENEGAQLPSVTEKVSFLRPILPGEILHLTCTDDDMGNSDFACSAVVTDKKGGIAARIGKITLAPR